MARPGDTLYEISRSSGLCAATGRQLATGEAYIAALVEREGEEGLARLDYTSEAWDQGERPKAPLRLFGFWRAQYEPAETRRQPLIDNDSLMDLFEQLEGAEDPSRQSFRYILALLLIRKRLLRLEGVRRVDGQSIMLLRPPVPSSNTSSEPAPPIAEVLDPGMDEDQIAAAIEQLGMVMAV